MAGSVANLTGLGRAAVYFFARGDERLAKGLIDRLVHEQTLRDAARGSRVCRKRLSRRTGEFIDLLRIYAEANGLDVAEAFVCASGDDEPEEGGTSGRGGSTGRR